MGMIELRRNSDHMIEKQKRGVDSQFPVPETNQHAGKNKYPNQDDEPREHAAKNLHPGALKCSAQVFCGRDLMSLFVSIFCCLSIC